MGLDMFLKKTTRYCCYGDGKNDIAASVQSKHFPEEKISGDDIEVRKTVCYWRKANQIHNWFVQNVQGGDDNHKEYFVSFENIKNLLETCKEVKANPNRAMELLPPMSGFFFGSTEVDEYYYENIDRTIEALEKIVEDHEKEMRMPPGSPHQEFMRYSQYMYTASW